MECALIKIKSGSMDTYSNSVKKLWDNFMDETLIKLVLKE
jgi:hypothetical protein